MTKQYFLAIDLGATSGRSVLGCFDGGKMEMKEWSRFKNHIIPMSGHLYWDLPALYNETLIALRRIAAEGIKLQSVGIDTWGCDFAFFGADGQLLGLPYCYRDSHTEGAQQEFFKRVPAKKVYERTGIQFMDFNSLFQLDTLRREGCVALKGSDKILFIPDALAYLLTGRAVTEYTVASTSQLLNPKDGDLDALLLEALGLKRSQFGQMVRPGTTVGELSEQVQKSTGVGAVPVVAVAGHDTASAVAAVPASDGKFAYLSCGTWSLLGIESPKPIINSESLRMNFTNEGGLDGTTRFLKNICGLWLMECSRKEFTCVPADVNELNALCLSSKYEGLINPDAPCFAHPESMIGAINEYCRTTKQDVPQSPADYLRCIFRSLALRYRQVLEMLTSLAPFAIRRLHVIGGGSLNRHLMQMTANAVRLPVICGPVEGTALGNLLVQVRAAGGAGTLVDMRRVAAASTELRTYEPQDAEEWNSLYQRFLSVQAKG